MEDEGAGPAGVSFFAAYLAGLIRDIAPGDGRLHHVVFSGGVLVAVGFLAGASLTLALLDLSGKSSASPQALQALNAVNEDFFVGSSPSSPRACGWPS